MKKGKREADVITVIRYGIVGILILYITMLIYTQVTSNTPFAEVAEAVEKTIDTQKMTKASERELRRFYGLSTEDYQEALLYYTNETMGVEEVLIVRSNDQEQMEHVMNAMEERKATRIASFEGYAPKQVKLLKNSIIKEKGGYALFVVSPNANKIEEAFTRSL